MTKSIKELQSAFEAHLKCFSDRMSSIEGRKSYFSRLWQLNDQSWRVYLFAVPFAGVADMIGAGFRRIFGNGIPLVTAKVTNAMPAGYVATTNHCCAPSFGIW